MADDYLGRKMEEYLQRPTQSKKRSRRLVDLLRRNRSHRAYDATFRVRHEQLMLLVEAARLCPSACNAQPLRYRLVEAEEAQKVLPHIRLGGGLPTMHFPPEGCEPNAFVVICTTDPKWAYNDLDVGIVAQTMLLQAVEIGLNGICIASFDREALRRELALPYEPRLVLAIGRGVEQISLVNIGTEEPKGYYRTENGTHCVPKIKAEELVLPPCNIGSADAAIAEGR